MHITLEADYAVRMVDYLAEARQRCDAGSIAEHTDVPQRFCLKILRNLVTAGIIRSFKGSRGGYELAAPPAEITLRQVIEAVEGPYRISRCEAEHPEGESFCCRSGGTCRFQQVYREISREVREKLDAVTFEKPSGGD